MTLKQLAASWKAFWFTPQSPASLCLFRICFGFLVLACCLLWAQDLLTWFGTKGIISTATMQEYVGWTRFSFLYMVPPSDVWVIALFIILIVSALFVTIGFCTRASLITLFLLLISFHHRNTAILNNGDTLLRISAFILIFSPAGEMFSLDHLIKKLRGKVTEPWSMLCPVWTQRLMQLQIAAIYCQTFLAEIEGKSWLSGTAMYYTSRLEEFWHLPVPLLLNDLWVCKICSWAILLIQFSLWTLIWIKEFRYYVLLAGIILHLSLDWMFNMPLVAYIMMASYLNFVDPEDLKHALKYIVSKLRAKSLTATR